MFGARFKGLSLYFLFLYQKGNLICIKTGLDTCLIKVSEPIHPCHGTPLMSYDYSNEISRENLYTPPPPSICGQKAFFSRGGLGVFFFEAPRSRNFICPPPFILWCSGTTPILEKNAPRMQGQMKIFRVGSRQFRESLRELLRELWVSY